MITVQLYGVARLQAGVSSFSSEAKTLKELRGMLPNISRKEAEDLVALVNGSGVKKSYQFKDGDIVVFLSPAGGG